jgi:hypothetical protein
MHRASRITSSRFGLVGLAIVIIVSGDLSPAIQPSRSNEGFLAMALLKTRLQQERIEGEIAAAEKELQANSRTIKEAEERMAIAKETSSRQAALVPGIDLRNARAARRNMKSTLTRLESARTAAEAACAVIKEKLVSSEGREPDSRIVGIISSSAKQVAITKRDGQKVPLKQDQPGFLEPGDAAAAKGAAGAELLFLDGRGTVQLDGEFQLEIEAAGGREQILRLARGKALLALESAEDIQRRLLDRAQRPDDDLTPVLQRFTGLSGSDLAQLFGEDLKLAIPGAVCAVRRARFTVEVKTEREVDIVVLEGTVEVNHVNGRDHIVVEEGFGAVVTEGGLSGPRRWPSQPAADPARKNGSGAKIWAHRPKVLVTHSY